MTRGLGFILAGLTTLLVLVSQHDVGVARDEVVYMDAADRYADWWLDVMALDRDISPDTITKTFGGKNATDNNREHPPLVKTLMGFSHRFLQRARTRPWSLPEPARGLGWLVARAGVSDVTAYRFAPALLHGLLVLLVFLMTLEVWGRAEGVVASLFVMFLPRALFHAGLAAFDAPIMTLWFASVYAYWRCLDGRKLPWQAGVAFGLALMTKHTAFLLPFAFVIHYPIAAYRAAGPRAIVTWRWPVIISLVGLAPITAFVVWPWLWFDAADHVGAWLSFHTSHVHYHFEYLGTNQNAPPFPWHVALVTTAFTVPVVTLATAFVGFARWIVCRTKDLRMPALLLGLSAAASIAPFFLGSTPIFGAEKHWMPVLPTLCIAAGVGTVWIARYAATLLAERFRIAAIAGVATIALAAAAVETVTAHPYALSWYNALAGGAPGGADLGMNRQFWGVSARGVLPVIAREAKGPGEHPVYSHDASPAWDLYKRMHLLPPNVPHAGQEQAGIDRSELAIVIHEKHFNRHDYMIWKTYKTLQPIYVLRADGVPIVSVYRRPK